MSDPFILWTVQRTGGTALFKFLKSLSEHPSAEDEPFNENRQFRWYFNRWARKEVFNWDDITGKSTIIKHCYDGFPEAFNTELTLAASVVGYKHIVLTRRDNLSRLVSRFVAEQKGTWFQSNHTEWVYNAIKAGEVKLEPLPIGEMVDFYKLERKSTRQLYGQCFLRQNIAPIPIDYDDLFTGELDRRRITLLGLVNSLGLRFPATPYLAELERQNLSTREIYPFIPNFEELKAALQCAEQES